MAEYRLIPEQNVEIGKNCLIATSNMPWLEIEPASVIAAHKCIRICYRTSFFDKPVRPLIRYQDAKGSIFLCPMNGPVFGSAEWIGPVPNETVRVFVSPTNQTGPFNFDIDVISGIVVGENPLYGLVRNGLWKIRDKLALAGMWKTRGIEVGLKTYDTTQVRLKTYNRRLKALARPLDIAGFDRPRTDWQRAPIIRLLAVLQRTSINRLEKTIRSLQSQVYPRWSLHILVTTNTPADVISAYRALMRSEPRLAMIDLDATLSSIAELHHDDWMGIVELGDTLPNYALAVVIETLDRAPNLTAIYGDEDAQDTNGRRHCPVFKPDWSPELQALSPYMGRLMMMRASMLCAQCRTAAEYLLAEEKIVARIIETIPYDAVGHIQRILYSRATMAHPSPPNLAGAPLQYRNFTDTTGSQWPKVAIIIPTRDRADLLTECVRGLNEMTDYPQFQVVIVDNGTTSQDALALLREISRHPNYTVLPRPGPFNYSSLCNDGAAAADAPLLVFLNNDVSMLDPNWLKSLARWAIRPQIGAVGAKLLYPQKQFRGRIQHAGVVLGIGDIAGHMYRLTRGDEYGYMAHLAFPHEVTAVTGACLAVERSKFEAIGGFDADNLPVELNDTDLCLRLAARGWRTIWTPEAILYHKEKASRGDPSNLSSTQVYSKERSYFVNKWANMIRDDPFFHPALSLNSMAVEAVKLA